MGYHWAQFFLLLSPSLFLIFLNDLLDKRFNIDQHFSFCHWSSLNDVGIKSQNINDAINCDLSAIPMWTHGSVDLNLPSVQLGDIVMLLAEKFSGMSIEISSFSVSYVIERT